VSDIEVFLNHHPSELDSLDENLTYQWLRGQTLYTLRIERTKTKGETEECAKRAPK